MSTSSDPTPLDPDQVSFTNVTYQVGLQGVGGQFLAWGDYNNDGYQDLLINGARLFENNGPPGWDFTEVTGGVGISGGSYGTWADWNNDGYLDLYTAGSDKLYRNNGPPDWDFSDVTSGSGIPHETYSTGVGWGDYDNDGDVDLYKLRGENWDDGTYYPDRFYRNNGNGTFTDVTLEVGVSEEADPKYGRGCAWADYNDDGWLDIYITNYRQQFNYLYENNGDGTFTDVGPQKGVADGPPYGEGGNIDPYDRAGHGVGSVWGDYDNDGYLDLWVTNLNHKDARTSDDSLLYHNDGPPDYTFTNMRDTSGIHIKPYVAPNEGDELFVGCAWGDYDNDGDLDLYLPQIYDIDYAYSFLYMNNGDGTFTDVTIEAEVRVWDTYAGCWSDYDNDGDLDLITSGRDSGGNADPHFIHLFRNDGDAGNWIHLNLRGDGVYSNSAAIGARVTVTTDVGDSQIKEVEGGMGCHGHQNSLTLEFGLGDYSGTIDIEIRWPHGKIQFIEDIDINQVVNIADESMGDIIVVDETFNNQNPIMGEEVRITARVRNSGSTVINTAEVKFYLDRIGDDDQILPTQILYDIYPDDEQTTYVDWNTAGISGPHTIYVKAEITDPLPPGRPGIISRNTFIRSENALPIAVLSAQPTSTEKGELIFFYAANSTDDTAIVEYYFDFGNGNTSGWVLEDSVNHTYQHGGDYNASLVVRDDDNGESENTAEVAIDVWAKPVAVLSVDQKQIFKEESAMFNASQSSDEDGTIEEYYFDFGDGESTDWIQNSTVIHVYLAVGDYNASLMVRDNDGRVNENTTEVVIEVWAKPIARLSANQTQILKEESVTFDASQSTDEDGAIVEYYFDFGDGESTDWIQDSMVTHAYPAVGYYNAVLRVRDNNGNVSGNTAEVVIEVNAKPIAVISATPILIYKGESVTFDASQSTDEDGIIEEHYFDFDDGEYSGWVINSTVIHTYSKPGDYNASLKVRDDDSDESENAANVIIEVRAKPRAVLGANTTSISGGESVTFYASRSSDEDGTIEKYYFDFGDGNSTGWVSEVVITHEYSSPNWYTASLQVMDNDGDISTNKAVVKITVKIPNQEPTAIIDSITPNPVTTGNKVTFIGHGEDEDGKIITYQWRSDIDDEFSDSQSFSTSALSIGTHMIYFRVQDDDHTWSTEVYETLVIKAFNEKPVLEVMTPRDNEVTSGRIDIRGIVEDPDGDVEEVEISVDGGTWETVLGTTDWSYQLDTTILADGEHILTVRAFDGEDYSEEEAITIMVNQEGKPGSTTDSDSETLLILVVVLAAAGTVIALAGIISLRSKKKKDYYQYPQQPAQQIPQQMQSPQEPEPPQTRWNW